MLVWHAIVRNEAAILPRAIASLLPHVDGAIVVDTGSSDGTPELIGKLFTAAGKPVAIGHAAFHDFAQARNEALAVARASSLPWTYALLSDADMDLVVDDPSWAAQLAGGAAYDVRQVAGGSLAYWNRRLLHRDATALYRCPTHEYLDAPSAGRLDGIWFRDHADGSNRPQKLKRDIALLEEALKTATNVGLVERMTFYLGQSYFDLGDWENAAKHYARRVELGGFEEERWNAQLHYAHCLDNLGRKPEFVLEMLRAYQMRPSRAETLYDLAKWFREQPDQQHVALVFAEAGLRLPYPKDDLLFVNDWVYGTGLREEYAICAFYDPRQRSRGAKVCSELALSGSAQARHNMFWYMEPLSKHVPSYRPACLLFEAPDNYAFTNPSVTNFQGRPVVLLRAVNYRIAPDGTYGIHDLDGNINPDWNVNPIRTRNFLFDTAAGSLLTEIALPGNWPEPLWSMVRGFEDSRLFEWRGDLWTLSAVRELTREGWCDQVLSSVIPHGYGDDWRVILFKPERRHEKNWMPWVIGDDLRFVYRLGIILDLDGIVIAKHDCGLNVERISGGSQVIEAEGNWLALVHEVMQRPDSGKRYYAHRFVLLHPDGSLAAISQPFVFFERQIEFCAGLAYFPDRHELMISFGVMDREAWTATMDLDDVLAFVTRVQP